MKWQRRDRPQILLTIEEPQGLPARSCGEFPGKGRTLPSRHFLADSSAEGTSCLVLSLKNIGSCKLWHRLLLALRSEEFHSRRTLASAGSRRRGGGVPLKLFQIGR